MSVKIAKVKKTAKGESWAFWEIIRYFSKHI
jgi:hypothetical protein